MGVITTADEHRRNVYEQVQKLELTGFPKLEKELKEMISPDVWGGDQWNKDFISRAEKDIKFIQKAQRKLSEMKRRY